LFNSLTVIAFIFLLSFVGFFIIKRGDKIPDGSLLKTKLVIFIDEQGATSVKSLLKEATACESLRTIEPVHWRSLLTQYAYYRTRTHYFMCHSFEYNH